MEETHEQIRSSLGICGSVKKKKKVKCILHCMCYMWWHPAGSSLHEMQVSKNEILLQN